MLDKYCFWNSWLVRESYNPVRKGPLFNLDSSGNFFSRVEIWEQGDLQCYHSAVYWKSKSLAIKLVHSHISCLFYFVFSWNSFLFHDEEDDKFWHILPGGWCGAAAELIWEFFVLRQLNRPNQPDQTSSQKLWREKNTLICTSQSCWKINFTGYWDFK